jgi:hypothetical protein
MPDITVVSPIPWRRLLAPVSVTIALIVWTVFVSPHSVYGDSWAIVPALLAVPTALIWHVTIVILGRGYRRGAVFVALCHVTFLVPIWFWSLTLISKDSL